MPTTTATAGDICLRAAKFSGYTGAGEVLAGEDSADILDILNGMLDAWSMDRLYIYGVTFSQFVLTANQQDYAIGPTGGSQVPVGFTTSQVPVKIENDNANIIITNVTPVVRRPLYVMDDGDWMGLSLRTPTTPTIPTAVYLQRMNEATNPNATLHFWPVPQAATTVELELWGTISQFSDVTKTTLFPPGYYEAVYQNLGLRMCTPEWGIMDIPSSVATLAQASRERIESLNMDPPPQLIVDSGLQGTRATDYRAGQQRFNIKNPSPQWYR